MVVEDVSNPSQGVRQHAPMTLEGHSFPPAQRQWVLLAQVGRCLSVTATKPLAVFPSGSLAPSLCPWGDLGEYPAVTTE